MNITTKKLPVRPLAKSARPVPVQPKVEVDPEWEDGEEIQSNWFKFETLGDKIKGTLMSRKVQVSNDPVFPDQLVVELKVKDGTLYNVGVSLKKQGTVDRLKKCQMGEIIGIHYFDEGEPTKPGFKPAKYLKVISFGMDPNYQAFEEGSEEEEQEYSEPAMSGKPLPDFGEDGE